MQDKYTVMGFLVAPLVASSILNATMEASMRGLVWVALFYVIAFAGMCVFALPLFLLLSATGMIRWWSCAASGLLVGGVIAWLVNPSNSGQLDVLLRFSLTGAVAALSFWALWWIGKRKDPETH
jgi:dipeptide/tripeptide permease